MLTCKVSNTISTKDLNDVSYRPKMELLVIADLMHCPESGYCNSEDGGGEICSYGGIGDLTIKACTGQPISLLDLYLFNQLLLDHWLRQVI